MALSSDGRFLYVVDQGGFQVHVIDASTIKTGVDAQGRIAEPDNFAAVIGRADVGRYPVRHRVDSPTIARSVRDPRGRVPIHAPSACETRPATATSDYPLCFPGWAIPTRRGTTA